MTTPHMWRGRSATRLPRDNPDRFHDLVLGTGEAAESDTHIPHWFGGTGDEPAEILSMFGPQGERVHARARTIGEGSRGVT